MKTRVCELSWNIQGYLKSVLNEVCAIPGNLKLLFSTAFDPKEFFQNFFKKYFAFLDFPSFLSIEQFKSSQLPQKPG